MEKDCPYCLHEEYPPVGAVRIACWYCKHGIDPDKQYGSIKVDEIPYPLNNTAFW